MPLPEPERLLAHWDAVAARVEFTHPLERRWLAEHVPRAAAVLDLGCGYGRVTAELHALGYRRAVGCDPSPAMIARGAALHPGLPLAVAPPDPLPFAAERFDAVLLFAVLTCVPHDAGQRRLVAEAARVLRPGGLLYVSDLPLQDDPLRAARYARDAERFGVEGAFEADSGAVCRHHSEARFAELFAGFELVRRRTVVARSVDGRPIAVAQRLLRRPAGDSA